MHKKIKDKLFSLLSLILIENIAIFTIFTIHSWKSVNLTLGFGGEAHQWGNFTMVVLISNVHQIFGTILQTTEYLSGM